MINNSSGEGPCRVCGVWSRTNDGDGPICPARVVNGKIRLSQCVIIDADNRRAFRLRLPRRRSLRWLELLFPWRKPR